MKTVHFSGQVMYIPGKGKNHEWDLGGPSTSAAAALMAMADDEHEYNESEEDEDEDRTDNNGLMRSKRMYPADFESSTLIKIKVPNLQLKPIPEQFSAAVSAH
jgi:hypothetical protein